MIGFVIATVAIAVAAYVLLRRTRPFAPRGFLAWPGFDGMQIVSSPYVPAGTVLVFGRGFEPCFDLGPITVGADYREDGPWRRFDMQARMSLQVNRPDAFVITTTGT